MSTRSRALTIFAAAIVFCAIGIGAGIGIGYGIFHKSTHQAATTQGTKGTTTTPSGGKTTGSTSTSAPGTTTPSTPDIPNDYGPYAKKVISKYFDHLQSGSPETPFFDRMNYFVDRFGPRYFGSKALSDSIDYLATKLTDKDVDFWTEDVSGQVWKRGKETAILMTPMEYNMQIFGYGGSPPTPPGGINATGVVRKTIDEIGSDINGTILVFNPDWTTYENISGYRSILPQMAHKYGALAVLIRSATPFSVYSGHTGQLSDDAADILPVASLTVEDAAMLERMQDRGQDITIHLDMTSSLEKAESSNLIIQVNGMSTSDEIVLISAHLDSWDLSYGALDDGAGVWLCVETMLALANMNSPAHPYGGKRPERTVRAVLYTGEEVGLYGSKQYFKNHGHEKHVFAMEMDMGIFKPGGLTVATRTRENETFFADIASLLVSHNHPDLINATTVNYNPYAVGEDIQPLIQGGTPGATLFWDHEVETWNYYLTFHHTQGDRMAQIDPIESQASFAVLLATVGIIADAPQTSDIYRAEMKAKQAGVPLIFEEVNPDKTLPYPYWYPFELRGHSDSFPDIKPQPSSDVNQTEFDNYNRTADDIYDILINGDLKGKYYERLANITDTFGPRIIGSSNLENAIDYATEVLKNDGFDNVHTENATLPHWIRGYEYGEIRYNQGNAARTREIKVLGLGGTPGTTSEGLVADIFLAYNISYLLSNKEKTKGKVVLFAPYDWIGYGFMSRLRVDGPEYARRCGAVGFMVHSATPRGVDTTHGGIQYQAPNTTHIPAVAISPSDADTIRHMIDDWGINVTIFLNMTTREDTKQIISRNTVAEITGREKPDEIVLISGHFDSWDVGHGAMDDGVGALLCWHAMRAFKMLGLQPRRSVRLVMWTAEEIGGGGSVEYYAAHKHENIIFAAESDFGVFKPGGLLARAGSNRTMQRLKTVMDRFGSKVNASSIYPTPIGIGEDVDYWSNVTGITPFHYDYDRMYDYYFTFHHSMADTMSVLKSDDLDLAAYLWAIVTYIVADAEEPFLYADM